MRKSTSSLASLCGPGDTIYEGQTGKSFAYVYIDRVESANLASVSCGRLGGETLAACAATFLAL
uniref:Uncharacterized protein n=1 Tax=Oryza punctata TaxID=4537 RepID=A0A0E0JQ11_ORYPU